MMYTVSLPGGARDYEFEAYIRLLERKGVDVGNTQRVLEPETGSRWLYAWDNQGDAQEFATELRAETENDRWKVYPLPNTQPTAGALGPIEILVNRRSDGCTYSLSPMSRKLIRGRFPKANLAPNVFISTVTQSDFELQHGPIWGHVASILTGLSDSQIDDLGGYRVVDPVARQIFRNAPQLSA